MTSFQKQTAGRQQLGTFAPKFAQLNDDVLFGEVWSRTDKLSLRDRSFLTITALISQGIIDSSLQYHLQTAKNNGITQTEISEILTQIGFYAGWPKAWAAFRLAKEVGKKRQIPLHNTLKALVIKLPLYKAWHSPLENLISLTHNISQDKATSPP